jgi:hypothetical protein
VKDKSGSEELISFSFIHKSLNSSKVFTKSQIRGYTVQDIQGKWKKMCEAYDQGLEVKQSTLTDVFKDYMKKLESLKCSTSMLNGYENAYNVGISKELKSKYIDNK